jgi:hypothetical protein
MKASPIVEGPFVAVVASNLTRREDLGIVSGITEERRRECDAVVAAVARWAAGRTDVAAVAMVGSYARAGDGGPSMASDVDLVVLTREVAAYEGTSGWDVASVLGVGGPIVRTQWWGPLLERRVRLPSGFEVELGFAPPSWATSRPVDGGTARVVTGGCVAVFDPEGVVAALSAAVAAGDVDPVISVVTACVECRISWPAGGAGSACVVEGHRHVEHEVHRHRTPVVLPDGTTVVAVSFDPADPYVRRPGGTPSFGLYLDPRWRPPWPHAVLDWPDFGVPDDVAVLRSALASLLDLARTGAVVELGCVGAHGRTGTALACLAVLASGGDLPASEAVAWVRSAYCSRAVETAAQEAFVAAF